MDPMKAFYLDLEQDLHLLILHYSMCEGATDPEVTDWARFFVRWAEKATKHSGPWSWKLLESAQNIVKELEKSKDGRKGYDSLGQAMAQASNKLNAEIKTFLLKGNSLLDMMK